MILADPAAERAVLAGLCRHGSEAFFDVADIVDANTFTIDSNSIIFSCVRRLFEEDDSRKIDVPSILSSAKEIGLADFFNNKNEISHLNAIMKFPVLFENVRKFAAKARKLQIARMMVDQLDDTKEKYMQLKGDESVSHILGLAEESIFDFTSLLNDHDDAPELLFGDLDEYLEERSENQIDQIGIATGFTKYDFAIGGGLRKGTVNVIGARTKVGKSLIGLNMGADIANRDIPVLYLDTEMTRKDQQNRGGSMISYGTTGKSTINDIETGQFANNDFRKNSLMELAQQKKNIPFYHKNIGGKPFEDQISIMRRWLAKVVGLNDQGKANDCVIVYDYVKLMEASELAKSDLKEFQLLGFMMTSLHNFALRYEVPILSFIQLNRDGINKESTDAASGSDRIMWLCSNFTIYKQKSDEEIAQDGPENGNRKLVPIIARHGEGLDDGDYINVLMKGAYAKLIEGQTAYELAEGGSYTEGEVDDEEDVAF
jgi:replicative DNA helicase